MAWFQNHLYMIYNWCEGLNSVTLCFPFSNMLFCLHPLDICPWCWWLGSRALMAKEWVMKASRFWALAITVPYAGSRSLLVSSMMCFPHFIKAWFNWVRAQDYLVPELTSRSQLWWLTIQADVVTNASSGYWDHQNLFHWIMSRWCLWQNIASVH